MKVLRFIIPEHNMLGSVCMAFRLHMSVIFFVINRFKSAKSEETMWSFVGESIFKLKKKHHGLTDHKI
jgi:hypothetical protein